MARSKSKNENAVGKTAEALIKAGSDVESRAGADGFNDFTVLMFASYHGHVSVVEHLLTARCEINAQSSVSITVSSFFYVIFQGYRCLRASTMTNLCVSTL